MLELHNMTGELQRRQSSCYNMMIQKYIDTLSFGLSKDFFDQTPELSLW